jgi:DNA-binding transcriptional MerR regulator
MTIKQIESMSGMTRANIRYYEQEGLLRPLRAANGYRDYSRDDLATLKRIKLLRGLQISLEEIRALQSGAAELSDILQEKLRELEQVRRDAGYAQDICRAIREDQATYAGLDAQKYLDAGAGYLSIEADTAPQMFYPWRRFFARSLDMAIYSALWWALLGLCFHVNLWGRGGILSFLDAIMALLLMLFLEPALLRLLGTTPGKWIFGLRLQDRDGRRPGYSQGLDRTLGVIGGGLGYGIPIYSAICLWKSYKRCSEDEPQPWDDELNYALKDTKKYRGAAFVLAQVLVTGAAVLIVAASRLPANRGDLTVAEFAQNYNAMAAHYGFEVTKRLDAGGQWKDDSGDPTIYIHYAPLPQLQYTVENGYVTGIGFEHELENSDEWLDAHNAVITLAMLSYVGAQREAGPFSDIYADIPRTVEENAFEDFTWRRFGVEVVCETEHCGYTLFPVDGGILIPEEGVDAYFSMVFSMKKFETDGMVD